MPQTAGELLREARARKNVTQKDLADRAGTTQASIARWEGGKESLTVHQLDKMLRALGLELELRARPISARDSGGRGFASILGRRGQRRGPR